jgi:hypothetical protein
MDELDVELVSVSELVGERGGVTTVTTTSDD